MQKVNTTWQPVAYASRLMSTTEERYAQVEKEALAITWACDKFSMYLLGKKFEIETDHKPLVPLLSSKPLDNLPPRVLRFRLRMMRYNYSISHVPGKLLYTADALSRAPVSASGNHEDSTSLQNETEAFVAAMVSNFPATSDCLVEFWKAQAADQTLSKVINFCQTKWPAELAVSAALKPY